MPEKDFDRWNETKKSVNTKEHAPSFHEREVWWCTLGLNVGHEQDGGKGFSRPVLVLRKFNPTIFWAVPFTTSDKENRFHMLVPSMNGSRVILSQLRLISSKRLRRFMVKIPDSTFDEIVARIGNLLLKE